VDVHTVDGDPVRESQQRRGAKDNHAAVRARRRYPRFCHVAAAAGVLPFAALLVKLAAQVVVGGCSPKVRGRLHKCSVAPFEESKRE
jgi:hypothetical protein